MFEHGLSPEMYNAVRDERVRGIAAGRRLRELRAINARGVAHDAAPVRRRAIVRWGLRLLGRGESVGAGVRAPGT